MKFFKRVFAFYINSSIHVALAVVALLAVSVLEYGLTIPKELWAFVFLGALTGYNFVKYAKIAGLHHRSLTNSLKTIQVFSGICFVLLVLIAFRLSITTLLVTAGFGLATFFYAVPFVRHKNLRNFSGLKIFIVAFVWAGVTVIVPFIASETAVSGDVLLTFFQRILIVVALILPFEIRDVPYDSLNLKTLPQQLGVRNTKLLGLAVLLVCLTLEFFKDSPEVAYIISLLGFCMLLGWLLVISKTNQSRYFASFWVEGLPIIWLLLFVLFEQF
ncbi:hypothetical protein POV26_01085 [Aequorivita todarodis]|uniref:hypothetical protein n=1 Tax=Aequorivita todarodis TaxID=2036821 RepID=UPI00234FF217|nr:hypothetical protein [Aequorivita todarodis]MDC7999624.1 hypothetical protein [Aequorivita todarodis]